MKNESSYEEDLAKNASDAAKVIGELGDPRAVEPLIVTLNDKNDGVQKKAIEARLKEIG